MEDELELLEKLLGMINEYQPMGKEKVMKAYEYAGKIHQGVKRQSGESYITHPLNVAIILAEMHADVDTICAGILHDCIEDGNITKEDIAKEFGYEVSVMVDGVSKIKKLHFSSKSEKNSANTRKIITSLRTDIRIIIIKLADRLHNMRTLSFKSEFKQKENALETMELFARLAYYIGAYRIKSELEDLSFYYLMPDEYRRLSELLKEEKEKNWSQLEEMLCNIYNVLSKEDVAVASKVRMKNIYGVYKRLQYNDSLKEIHDLFSLKIMVPDDAKCYQTLGLVHQLYNPVNHRFKDYICQPKTNLYQSLHTTVFGPNGQLVQTQIRTFEMDKVASFGLPSYWETHQEKARDVMQQTLQEKLQFFKRLEEIDDMFTDNQDFINQVDKEILSPNIYVYNSKGDCFELPYGSTPIDLAYTIGDEVGNRVVGAYVDNKPFDLEKPLENKDIVKLELDREVNCPCLEWLDSVKTSRAKQKIKSYYRL